ncbi:MAG: hypothetical protein RR595_13265 [Lysinibacillus sp.]
MLTKHPNRLSSDFFQTYLTLIMDNRNYSLEEAIDYMTTSYFNENFEIYGTSYKEQFELAITQLV